MATLKGKALLSAVILGLLASGSLNIASLPEYYCQLENSTERGLWTSPSNITLTKVSLVSDGVNDSGFVVVDDRCQKGREFGQWIPLETLVRLPVEQPTRFDTKRPIIMTRVNYYQNTVGDQFAIGQCYIPLSVI